MGTQQPFKPYHQLATFAPSKGDILNTLEFFFGKPAQPEKLNDFSEHHAATYHFPDAYLGKNVHLRDTLNNLILSSPQDWQTTVALPWMKIEGVTVAWDEVHFDVRLLQRVPYEGASRMQTSMRRSHRDRVVRRGIALIVESDFYRTEAGRKYFSDQVTSIRYCVQETANYDVLFSYLTCHNYDHHWDISKNLLPHRNMIAAMKQEIVSYAIVQKDGRGLDLIVEKGKQRMARYHVTPNMLVMAPETQLYVTMVPPEKIVYSEAGERGPSRFESYNGNQGWPSFRGLNCFTSNPFDSGDTVDSVQMLRRQTQVGEFYVMRPPNVLSGAGPLPSSYMDLLIYDEERDMLKHIHFRDAVLHAQPWEAVKFVKAKKGSDPMKWDELLTLHGESLVMKTMPIDMGIDDKKEALKTMKNLDPTNPEDWMTMCDYAEEGTWVPIKLVIARPFIEHHMLSAVMTVAGTDTGATLFGPADMQIAANTTVKVVEGHYTCHTKSVITKPQNVMVLRDIQCDGYVAGGDTTWFGEISEDGDAKTTIGGGPYKYPTSESVSKDLRSRLDFESEDDNKYASLLAFVCPYTDSDREQFMQDNAFSLTTSNLPWDIGNGQQGQRNFPGGLAFWEAYSSMFDLNYITAGTDPSSVANHDFVRNGTFNNAICLLGPHRSFSPFTTSHFDLTPGQGHFGPDALPGDARWRRGEAIDADSARGALVGVEALAESKKAMNRLRST